jgi:predicted nucleotidyltransferase
LIDVTYLVTIVPRMSTILVGSELSAALFGQTRRAVLGLLFSHPGQSYYLRHLVRSAGLGLGAAQREVKRLSDAGIIRRTLSGHQVFYQANSDCPIFDELKGLMVKTACVADALRAALAPLAAQIRVAFIYGSVARLTQKNGSDVDIMVVGESTFGDVVAALGSAQETLAREINPTVYSPAEFRSKLKAGHHFLTAVAGGEKTLLIGDEHELRRLGAKRLGRPT